MARQLNVQAADWLDTCRELAGWEDQHLVEGCGPESLSEHSRMLDRLEGTGRGLAAAAAALDPDAAAVARQMASALQDLRDSRSMWHGNTPPARRQEILRDCFHEPRAAAVACGLLRE
jgi:hypothetical protein